MQTIFFSYFCEVPMRYIPQLKSDLPVYLRACLHGVSLCRHKNLQLSYGGWAGEASVKMKCNKMILTCLECALQDEEFEYFWGSVQPSVQNLKISHAVKRPKAVGLDRHEGPDQCFFTCLTMC